MYTEAIYDIVATTDTHQKQNTGHLINTTTPGISQNLLRTVLLMYAL